MLALLSVVIAADLAIRHATVLPVSAPPIPDGTVIIDDGRIVAVGAGLAVPAGTPELDATGQYLMPGIIDVHSHMGVYAWPDANAHGDGNEAVEAFTPRVWAGDSFDPEDPAIPRARAGGVTTIQVLPGSANLIGGQSAVLKLRPSRMIDNMIFSGAQRGMKMAVGENPKRVYASSTDDDQLLTRMGLFAALREKFQEAVDYRARQQSKAPGPVDLDLEAILQILDSKLRVNLHCYRSHDIAGFFRVADAFGFKVTALHHAIEAYKVRDLVIAHGTAIATWPDWWGFKMESWDGIPQNAVLFNADGGLTALHSDSPDHIQRLYLEAAKLVRYGMPEADALQTITLNPARILGVEARVGSIEVGKDADLALFDKHPFDVYTRVQKTWIDGVIVYDRATEGVPNGIR